MNKSGFETIVIELKTISPIHIAGGNLSEFTKLNIFNDHYKREMRIIDEKKWMHFLNQNNLIKKYQEYIRKKAGYNHRNRVNNLKWIKSKVNISKNEIENMTVRTFDTNTLNDKYINDLQLFVRQNNNEIFIPGSSIKGAIRTAMIVGTILENKDHYQKKYWPQIKRVYKKYWKKRDYDLSRIVNDIENEVFNISNSKNIGISVSDSFTNKNPETILLKDIDYIIKKNEFNEIPNIREYIKPNETFEISIKIDSRYSSRFDIYSVNDVLKVLNSFKESLFSNDGVFNVFNYNKFLPNINQNNILILGGNTGFHQKTILHSLAPNSKELLEVVKTILHKPRPKFAMHKGDKLISPRTLNLIEYENNKIIAGLVALEIK